MPPVPSQHQYVQCNKAKFLENSKNLFLEEQHAKFADSNILEIPISRSKRYSGQPPFGLHTKKVDGKTFI
jgi:hypothetical protein